MSSCAVFAQIDLDSAKQCSWLPVCRSIYALRKQCSWQPEQLENA